MGMDIDYALAFFRILRVLNLIGTPTYGNILLRKYPILPPALTYFNR